MRRSAATCSVCHQQRTEGSHEKAGETFICVDCQADAKQLIEIQDAVWGPAGDTHELAGGPSNDTQKPRHP